MQSGSVSLKDSSETARVAAQQIPEEATASNPVNNLEAMLSPPSTLNLDNGDFLLPSGLSAQLDRLALQVYPSICSNEKDLRSILEDEIRSLNLADYLEKASSVQTACLSWQQSLKETIDQLAADIENVAITITQSYPDLMEAFHRVGGSDANNSNAIDIVETVLEETADKQVAAEKLISQIAPFVTQLGYFLQLQNIMKAAVAAYQSKLQQKQRELDEVQEKTSQLIKEIVEIDSKILQTKEGATKEVAEMGKKETDPNVKKSLDWVTAALKTVNEEASVQGLEQVPKKLEPHVNRVYLQCKEVSSYKGILKQKREKVVSLNKLNQSKEELFQKKREIEGAKSYFEEKAPLLTIPETAERSLCSVQSRVQGFYTKTATNMKNLLELIRTADVTSIRSEGIIKEATRSWESLLFKVQNFRS